MIWWFLISINFLFFLLKSFFTPKYLINLNEIYSNPSNSSTEKYILGEDYNLTSIKLKVDFGSLDTGTKIIEYSKGIINIKSIQQNDHDSYMLTPCRSNIWWIYSFSDIIHIEKIGLVSLEHYASNFKVIEILGSDIYPTTKWKKLGKISTNFTKSFELFNIYDYCKNYDEDNCWVKYLKINVLSHHNIENNYYCTLTHFQIFASSGVDMLSDKIYSDEKKNENEKELQDKYIGEKNERIYNGEGLKYVEEDFLKKELEKEELEKRELQKKEVKKQNYKEEYLHDNFSKNNKENEEKNKKKNKDNKEYKENKEESVNENAEKDIIIKEEINKYNNKEKEMKNNKIESKHIPNATNANNNDSFTNVKSANNILIINENKIYNSYYIMNKVVDKKYKNLKTISDLRISSIFKNFIFRTYKNKIDKIFNYNRFFKKENTFKYNDYNLVSYMKNNYSYKNDKKYLKQNSSYEKKNIAKIYKSFRKKFYSLIHLILKKIFLNSNNYSTRGRNKIKKKKKKSYIINRNQSAIKKIKIPIIRNTFIDRNLCNSNISCLYHESKKLKKLIKLEYNTRKSITIKYLSIHIKKNSRIRKIIKGTKNKKRCNLLKNIFLKRKIKKINENLIFDYYYDKMNIKFNAAYCVHKDNNNKCVSDKTSKNKKVIKNKTNKYCINPSVNYMILYLISSLKKKETYTSKLIKYCTDTILLWEKKGKVLNIIYSLKKKKLTDYLYYQAKCFNILHNFMILKKKRIFVDTEHICSKKYVTQKGYNLIGEDTNVTNNDYDINIRNNTKCNEKHHKNKDILIYKRPNINNLILTFLKITEKSLLFNYHINSIILNKNNFENMKKFFYSIWNSLFYKKKLRKVIKLNKNNIIDSIMNYINEYCKKKKNVFNNIKSKYIQDGTVNISLPYLFYRINKKQPTYYLNYLKMLDKKSKNELHLCVRYYVNSFFIKLIINHIKFLKKQSTLQRKNKNTIKNFNNIEKIKNLAKKLFLREKNNVDFLIPLYCTKKKLEGNKSSQDICLTTEDVDEIIYSDKDLKEYVDDSNMKNVEKERLKNLVNLDYQDNNENSIKILNEIKKNEEINNKLINDVYDIIREYDIYDNNLENYALKLKTGKKVSLIINKEDKKENERNNKSKEEKLNYFEEFDKIIDGNINFNDLNCVSEEKVEEKAKNSRGHALLTLVDKVKTIENKNNYIVSKLKDIIKITNNKTKITYQMLVNFKMLQNTINLLLKYIVMNEKNMKNLNINRKNTENFLKIIKEICIIQINDKSKNLNSLKYLCKYLKDFLFDELEKKYYFGNIRGNIPLCDNEENILHNKNTFVKKNPDLVLKEKKKNIFNFLYYENHCHKDIFKTTLLYYNSPVDSIQGIYFKIFYFFKELHYLPSLLLRIKYYKNMFFKYIKNENNFYVFFICIFLIIFIMNNFLCYMCYKHLSNKLNTYIKNCNCHNK